MTDDHLYAAPEWKALLDAAVDAIIVIDHRGHIETFNSAAETIFGFSAAEILGKNVSLLMPEPVKIIVRWILPTNASSVSMGSSSIYSQ